MVIYVIYKYGGSWGWLLNVGLAGGHLCEKMLFAWLSLVVSVMVSFCDVLFSAGCLGWALGLGWVSFSGFSFLLLGQAYRG